MDPFIVPTVPKISVVPATPDSNTFRKNIKNQNLDHTSQCQNSIEEINDNHFDPEVNNNVFTIILTFKSTGCTKYRTSYYVQIGKTSLVSVSLEKKLILLVNYIIIVVTENLMRN